jgi:sigma-B regulation protein RsbU (phosphoserine phosphatase)
MTSAALDVLVPPATPWIDPTGVGGLDIAAFCSSIEGVGGDYCDVISLPSSNWSSRQQVLVAIGDVSGHGIRAALVMRTARGILRSRATLCSDPCQLLSHLNELLICDVPSGCFMTMHLARIDTGNGQVAFAGAGHDPVLLYDSQSDEFREMKSDGLPLGIDAGAAYSSTRLCELTSGQILVLGTDGLWETRNDAGEMFGKRRLRESIRRAANRPAQEILAEAKSDLKAFRGAAPKTDDATLMIVKATRAGHPRSRE